MCFLCKQDEELRRQRSLAAQKRGAFPSYSIDASAAGAASQPPSSPPPVTSPSSSGDSSLATSPTDGGGSLSAAMADSRRNGRPKVTFEFQPVYYDAETA
eukprot:Opistho-1_new@41787